MHYVDYAATTPLVDEALEAMLPYLKEHFGNPSSLYGPGRDAKRGVEEAREQVADAIGASPSEIVFTGGGSEADNLAIKGTAFRNPKGHFITTTIEHHAVLDTAEWLEANGAQVTYVPVDSDGVIDLNALEQALRPDTVLVSVMAANNEVGAIQPLKRVVEVVRSKSKALVHTDAVQALGKIPLNVSEIGVDLAAFSAHKVGGPKGTGALFVKSKTKIEPLIHGGGQERGLRSGTHNVAGIAGLGAAALVSAKEAEQEGDRLQGLRDRLQSELESAMPGLTVNAAKAERLPGLLSVCIPGTQGDSLLLMLDRAGICASSGSACQSGSLDPSHVLVAMGVDKKLAFGSVRFTFGRRSTDADVDAVVQTLPKVVAKLRRVS